MFYVKNFASTGSLFVLCFKSRNCQLIHNLSDTAQSSSDIVSYVASHVGMTVEGNDRSVLQCIT